jgi:hypothetical protein
MSDNAVWDPGLDLTPEKDIPTWFLSVPCKKI